MSALGRLLAEAGEPSTRAVRDATAADLAASDEVTMFPADQLGAESRRLLRARPEDVQLWCTDVPRPVSAGTVEAARAALPIRSAWGRMFVLHSDRRALAPAVRDMQLALGVQVRVGPAPVRMLVVGSDLALVTLGGVGHRVTDAGLVTYLRQLFVRVWRWSEPVGDEPPGSDVLEVVSLLTSGLTDQAAAARMHVSLRTYRRRIRELLDCFEVSSRFAAGVEADRRGLITLAEALERARLERGVPAPVEPGPDEDVAAS